MDPVTAKRLRDFSRRSGLTQSAIVSGIIRCGLDKLESNWRSADEVLAETLSGPAQKAPRRKRPHGPVAGSERLTPGKAN